MSAEKPESQRQSVTSKAAQNLATTTKTTPQMVGVTPRWLVRLLPWVNVDAGTYRVNRRKIAVKADTKVRLEMVDGRAVITPTALRSMSWLAELDDAHLERLASKFKTESFTPGDTVFREGDAGDRFYIVVQGKVEVTTTGEHGERLRIGVIADGDYFGEMALLNDVPRLATVQSLTRSVLVSLGRDDFSDLLGNNGLREQFERVMDARRLAKEGVNQHGETVSEMAAGYEGELHLPETLVDYEEEPREYPLSIVQTVVRVHTRVTDLYNQPFNQLREQIRLTVETMKERQEWEIINNPDFGLRHNVAPSMRVVPRSGPPTPDDLDDMLARVWKQPAFFLAHPRAIAAFGRECTRRGVPPPTVSMFGSPFLTWRGVPMIPCDKLAIRENELRRYTTGVSDILLMRVGEAQQGVVGLHQAGIPGEQMPSLSVRFMGINPYAVASYLVTLYFSCAVLTDDALAVLENVEVGNYHDYD